MTTVLDPVAPYASSREHVLDEVAVMRAKALGRVGGVPDEPAPSPLLVGQRAAVTLGAGQELKLSRLQLTFDLSPVETHVLIVTLAAEIDPLFRAVTRGMQGEMSGPTLQVGTIVELVADGLDEAVNAGLLFLPDGRLRQNALISVEDPLVPRDLPLQALRVKIDRAVALWLIDARDSAAPPWMRPVLPERVLERARLPADKKADLVAHLGARVAERQAPLVEICGPAGVGKKYLAEGLCAELGRPLLVVDCRQLAQATGGLERDHLGARLAEVRREALLSAAVPYLDHFQSLLSRHEPQAHEPAGGEQSQQVRPSAIYTMPPELSQFLGQIGLCFVGNEERYEPLGQAAEVVRVALPFPTPRQRAAIWEQTFEALRVERGPDLDFLELGRKLALDPGRIQAAARAAASAALLRARGPGPLEIARADLIEASRHQLQHDLKSLAVRVDKTYEWGDLVISVDGYHALTEMISYAANAEKVYEQWGFAKKHTVAQGISALFSGPPGTGKTMCASVIARELDMELFRVDLSRVVSKWIGETEKNLARVFDEAQRSHAVVLFDEADSLFAKRTEVKSSVDRYANLEVNYLLQRMETFDGITILTTNFEDTIDSAFKRRLTFRIRFEKPDGDARAALWQKMFPPSAELAADVDFVELGRRYEVSGGNIRNAAIRAAFLAASENHPIDMNTLERATLREAREMGVLIAEPRPAPEASSAEAPRFAAAPPTPAATDGDEPPPEAPKPRLVPITHRR